MMSYTDALRQLKDTTLSREEGQFWNKWCIDLLMKVKKDTEGMMITRPELLRNLVTEAFKGHSVFGKREVTCELVEEQENCTPFTIGQIEVGEMPDWVYQITVGSLNKQISISIFRLSDK